MFKLLLTALALLFTSSVYSLQVSGLSNHSAPQPGETVRFAVTLISDKDKPELVDLKLCDYWCNSEGQHFFEPVGEQKRTNADWISLSSHREIVNPNETREIIVTVKVPENRQLTGSYWSVLLIEPTDPLHTLVESEHGFQLNVKVRYAYHIVTDIGKGSPALKITNKTLAKFNDKNYFAVDVTNTGDLFLNPKMSVKFLNNKGKLEKTLETQSDRLYPGSSTRFLAEAEDLTPGKYTTFLLLDNGDGRLFGDTFELTNP